MRFPPPRCEYDADGRAVIADWYCPVCGAYTPRTVRPGRPSVYCTNACRQKAYRYRRRHGIRLLRGDGQPTERGRGYHVTHLTRPSTDPIGEPRTSNRKAVSLCGAFIHPVRDHPDVRPDFIFDDAHNCYRCLELTGSARPDPPMIHHWLNFRKRYTGPPHPPIPAPPRYTENIRGAPKPWRRQPAA